MTPTYSSVPNWVGIEQPARVARTRALLLSAAYEVLRDVGYSGFSLRRVASRADLTTGALQHHFRRKSDLLVALVTEVLFGSVDTSEIRLDDQSDVLTRASDFVRELWARYDHPDFVLLQDMLVSSKEDAVLRTALKDWIRAVERNNDHIVRVAFAEWGGLELSELSRHIDLHMSGLAVNKWVYEDLDDIDEQLALLAKTIVFSLGERC